MNTPIIADTASDQIKPEDEDLVKSEPEDNVDDDLFDPDYEPVESSSTSDMQFDGTNKRALVNDSVGNMEIDTTTHIKSQG